ncbi:MAG: hypothetical protein AAFU70_14280, partial [Planctomycetota bacterium]
GMDAILELWIPIVLATIAVFIASSLLWMVSPHHKADVKAPQAARSSSGRSRTSASNPARTSSRTAPIRRT